MTAEKAEAECRRLRGQLDAARQALADAEKWMSGDRCPICGQDVSAALRVEGEQEKPT